VEVPFARAQNVHFDGEALRRQDAAEFEALYHAFAPELERYLSRLIGDPFLAQDLLQDTFVKAYRALPHTRPDALLLRPWLYKIATNTARSAVRSAARRAGWKRVLSLGRSGEHGEPGSHEDEPDMRSADFEARFAEAELVERTLAAIKPDYAAPLLLHWREGFSIDELCAILGLSRDNVKKRLYRAKKAFAAAYSQQCTQFEEKEEWR
jgi:RNA polymerase sigma-70 factor, ECF subfamily